MFDNYQDGHGGDNKNNIKFNDNNDEHDASEVYHGRLPSQELVFFSQWSQGKGGGRYMDKWSTKWLDNLVVNETKNDESVS